MCVFASNDVTLTLPETVKLPLNTAPVVFGRAAFAVANAALAVLNAGAI